MPTPRLFIVRHGETEWSKSGAHTGLTDIPLTLDGERRVRSTARALVGPKRLIVPGSLAAVYVSPRQRARRTLGLLLEEGDAVCAAPNAASQKDEAQEDDVVLRGLGSDGRAGLAALRARGCAVELCDDIREWEYGDYEGLKTSQITEQRRQQGKAKWDIWSEGAPGGESPAQVTARLDRLIADIRRRFHEPAFAAKKQGNEEKSVGDVVVVAHGHILRCLACRWLGQEVTRNPHFIVEAGGVGTLSYEHDSIAEPALVLGGAFIGEGNDERETAHGHHG